MALLQRHLTALAAFVTGLTVPGVTSFAQSAPPPVMFRTLAVGNSAAVANLFYESKGRSVPLLAGSLNLSPFYPAPDDGHLVIYRELPAIPPETKPRKLVVAETRLVPTGPSLVMLAATIQAGSPGVTALTVNDAWDAQPADTVRVFNFSRRRTAIQLESATVELATAQSRVLPLAPDSRIADLKIAVWEKEAWQLESANPPAIIPRTRLVIVITDLEPTPQNPRPTEVNVFGIYDTNPPAAPKKDFSTVRTSSKPPRPAT